MAIIGHDAVHRLAPAELLEGHPLIGLGDIEELDGPIVGLLPDREGCLNTFKVFKKTIVTYKYCLYSRQALTWWSY